MDATPRIASALALARQYPEELGHAEQVTRLAGMLFDAFQPLHGLGSRERELLVCAALLHDIGFSVAPIGHHRASLRLILQGDLPALTAQEKLVVANVARYHRKSLPSPRHPQFAQLPPEDRAIVCRLAALLRIADGFDRMHDNAVSRLRAGCGPDGSWTLVIAGPGNLLNAASGGLRKADLFQEVFGVGLQIEMEEQSGRGDGVEGPPL